MNLRLGKLSQIQRLYLPSYPCFVRSYLCNTHGPQFKTSPNLTMVMVTRVMDTRVLLTLPLSKTHVDSSIGNIAVQY